LEEWLFALYYRVKTVLTRLSPEKLERLPPGGFLRGGGRNWAGVVSKSLIAEGGLTEHQLCARCSAKHLFLTFTVNLILLSLPHFKDEEAKTQRLSKVMLFLVPWDSSPGSSDSSPAFF
jgi:hypothetical protein